MRAVLADPATSSLVVADVDDPTPAEGQLLVRVRAAGLNRADLAARAGAYRTGPAAVAPSAPFIAGAELAGEVVGLGPGVEGWQVGDRLMGRGRGYAELAAVDQDTAMPAPPSLTWEEAGALPVALMTMHDALATNGRLVPGEAVLIHAATSGVGVVGVPLAAHLGASVVLATSRSAAKLEVLTSFLGTLPCPLVTIDTSSEDFAKAAIDHTGKGIDVIIDNVGASVLAGNVAAAAIKGRIVQVGRLGGRLAEVDLDELARKRLSLVGVTFRTRTAAEVAEVMRRCVEAVGGHLERFRPRIERVFPLGEAAAAQAALAQDAHVGKLVLVP
ncbi:MAG TPA: zinc-binding dehydrogenase [Acidimicrobiales bacterium]|nr:zinc-binding dehydrogenase [Acidimicrobiales bacterium]